MLGWTQKAGKKCARVSYTYFADDDQLSSLVEAEIGDIQNAEGNSGPSVVKRSARLTGRGEAIVDPATMLCYGETDTWKIDLKLLIEHRSEVEVTTQRWSESNYTYK